MQVDLVIQISNTLIKYFHDLNMAIVLNMSQISLHNRIILQSFNEENAD